MNDHRFAEKNASGVEMLVEEEEYTDRGAG